MASVFGLDVEAVPDGYIPLDAIVLVKALDNDGDETLLIRSTDGLRVWERMGIAQCALDLFRDQCKDAFVAVEDDEDFTDGEDGG